jgi:hypothetical protein
MIISDARTINVLLAIALTLRTVVYHALK